MNRLCAPFHVELKACCGELFGYWAYETLDIGIARTLGGVQLLLYHIVSIMLQILQREVFQLALQLIEAQLMCKRGIEIAGLFRHFVPCLLVISVTYLPHQVHPVGYHDEYHPHILGKAEQQIPEVLAFYDRILLIKALHFHQTMNNSGHSFAVIGLHLLH